MRRSVIIATVARASGAKHVSLGNSPKSEEQHSWSCMNMCAAWVYVSTYMPCCVLLSFSARWKYMVGADQCVQSKHTTHAQCWIMAARPRHVREELRIKNALMSEACMCTCNPVMFEGSKCVCACTWVHGRVRTWFHVVGVYMYRYIPHASVRGHWCPFLTLTPLS
jgi:hypothetical protein